MNSKVLARACRLAGEMGTSCWRGLWRLMKLYNWKRMLSLVFEKEHKGSTHTYIPGVCFCFWLSFRLENSGRAKRLLPGFLIPWLVTYRYHRG